MAKSEEIDTEVDNLLIGAKDRKAVTEALTFLFPKLSKILNLPTGQYADSAESFRRRRISNAEYARAYFNLTPDDIVWGKSHADALAIAVPQRAFDDFRTRLLRTPPQDRAKLRRVFVDLLSSITEKTEHPLEWFMALVENARSLLELIPENNLGLFDLGMDSQITFLLIDILRPLDAAARGDIVSHAISHADDVSFICNVFRSFVGDVEEGGTKGQLKDALGKSTNILRDRLVRKVEEIAKSGQLYEHVRPEDILWFWWGSGHGNELRQHTTAALDNPTLLRSLLRISISTVVSSAGNYERVDRQSWSKIVDLKELHARAVRISTDPSHPDFEVSKRFLAAYARFGEDEF